jgi:predicted nucleotidyltransferase
MRDTHCTFRFYNFAVDIERLAQVFARHPEVLAVYLFGSHAEGRQRLDSDIDLGILPATLDARKHKLDLLADLVQAGFENVDLVYLDTHDVVVKHQAVRLNHVIYHTPAFDRGGTYSRIVREYLDFLPYLNVQQQAMKRRLQHAQA